MRILLAHGDTRSPENGEGGGGESLCRDTIDTMTGLGHDVLWWHYQTPIQEAVMQFNPDVALISTLVLGITPNGHAVFDIPTIKFLSSTLPSVLQLNDYWPFCEQRMCLVGKQLDETCSACSGACDFACGLPPTPYRDLVNSVPVMTLNPYSAAIFKQNGIRADYIWPIGVDEKRFKPGTKNPDNPRIVTSSAWAAYPTKGMHILNAACTGKKWGVSLMTGLPRSKVAEVLAKSDIYVFPSCYEETWGLCLNEALASGCACVASDVAGAKAQIEHGYNGLIIPKRDPRALAEAVELLIDDAELRHRLQAAARKTVEEKFTLTHMGKRLEAILTEVSNGHVQRRN